MNHPTFHVEHAKLQHLESCPICGGAALKTVGNATDHTVSRATFELQDCALCGFRMTNPRPGPNSIGAFYLCEEYISHTNSDQGLQNKLYQAVRQRALASKYKLIHKEHPNGQVLDVGCGTGEFLAYLTSRGHLVQGVEPDVRAREQAIANHNG